MKRAGVGLLFLASAVALSWIASSGPETIERVYSRRLYPVIAAFLSGASARVPISLAEVLVAALAVGLVARVVFALRAAPRCGWFRSVASLAADLLLLAGGLVFCFVFLWGLNYRRQPFAVIASLDARPASVAELSALASGLATRANDLRQGLPEDALGVLRAPGGAVGVLDRTGLGFEAAARRYPALAGRCLRPKPVVLSEAMSWLGISGIYSPFTGEANVNVKVPDPELPFAAAHETAHQRGFAREDEANFAGYLACRFHPDPVFQYAGLLAASVHASNALHAVDRATARNVEALRSAAVQRDLRALREWAARYEGPAARAAERVNDAYLKSQGAPDGVRSYGRMVDLLLAERRADAAGPREGAGSEPK